MHYWAETAFQKKTFWFFDLLLPLFHIGSFLFFYQAVQNFKVKVGWIWIVLIFLNPLIFIYFRYPFYSTFLFFLNSALLFLLSKRSTKPGTILWIACLFSIGALLRSTYSIFLFLPVLLWLTPKIRPKTVFWILLIMLPPFLWQFKNYMLIGKFTTSSWIGMNLARCHLPWNVHNDLVDFIPPFSMPDSYFEILNDDPGIITARKETNYYLSQNNLNHRAIPVISDLYLESIGKNFSLSWSINSVLNGFFILFKSPANEPHILKHLKESGYTSNFGWNPDFFEPIGYVDALKPWYLFFESSAWDPENERLNIFKSLTIYTFFYPFLLIWFGVKFRTLPKEERLIFLLALFFTLIYCSMDIFEANRMRMEYEVFFYFLALKFVSDIFKPKPTAIA